MSQQLTHILLHTYLCSLLCVGPHLITCVESAHAGSRIPVPPTSAAANTRQRSSPQHTDDPAFPPRLPGNYAQFSNRAVVAPASGLKGAPFWIYHYKTQPTQDPSINRHMAVLLHSETNKTVYNLILFEGPNARGPGKGYIYSYDPPYCKVEAVKQQKTNGLLSNATYVGVLHVNDGVGHVVDVDAWNATTQIAGAPQHVQWQQRRIDGSPYRLIFWQYPQGNTWFQNWDASAERAPPLSFLSPAQLPAACFSDAATAHAHAHGPLSVARGGSGGVRRQDGESDSNATTTVLHHFRAFHWMSGISGSEHSYSSGE